MNKLLPNLRIKRQKPKGRFEQSFYFQPKGLASSAAIGAFLEGLGKQVLSPLTIKVGSDVHFVADRRAPV